MTNVAQKFDPTQTRGLEAVDAWRVRRKDPIILDLNNIHVPLPENKKTKQIVISSRSQRPFPEPVRRLSCWSNSSGVWGS